MKSIDKSRPLVIALLNRILEQELAGVVRYTHYSFMIFGHSRIPIVAWLRSQASESLAHAHEAGEMITLLGGSPGLSLAPLESLERYGIDDILRESLKTERAALDLYRELLGIVRDGFVALEEYARRMIAAEEMHAGEVEKMLRKPG